MHLPSPKTPVDYLLYVLLIGVGAVFVAFFGVAGIAVIATAPPEVRQGIIVILELVWAGFVAYALALGVRCAKKYLGLSRDEKVCPFCGESVLSVALKCKHCHCTLPKPK